MGDKSRKSDDATALERLADSNERLAASNIMLAESLGRLSDVLSRSENLSAPLGFCPSREPVGSVLEKEEQVEKRRLDEDLIPCFDVGKVEGLGDDQ